MKQFRFLILFLTFFLGNKGSAQTSKPIDSLLSDLKTMEADTNMVKSLNNIFNTYFENREEIDNSRKHVDSLLQISKELDYAKGIANAHFYYSNLDQFEGNFKSAIDHLSYYLAYCEKQNDSLRMGDALFAMGKAYKSMSDFENSLHHLYRCALIYENTNHKNGLATAFNSIGSINKQIAKYDEAIRHYNKANTIFMELNNTKMYAMGLQNIGNVYNGGKKEYKKAITYYNQALQFIDDLELAYEKAIILGNLGSVHNRLDQDEKALAYHLQAYEIKKTLPNKRSLAYTLAGIGATYMKLDRYNRANENLDKGLAIAIEMGAKDIIADLYGSKALLGKKKKDYKMAYENINLSHQWKDSILNENVSKQINELQAKYETAEKEKAIALLTTEKEVQEKETRRKATLTNAIIGGLVFTLLLAGLLFYTFRQRVKNQKLLSQKNAEITEVNFKQQLSDLEMKALRAQMNPHFVFNCLNSINRMILGGDIKDASSYLTKFSRLIRKVLENSEKNMVSLSDELTMLKAYIQLESLRFKGKIAYKTEIDKNVNLDATFVPSMVLQPLVENAIWHGLMHKEKGGTVKLSIEKEENILKCSIEDDGVGREKNGSIDSGAFMKEKSMGLQLTAERLKIMGKIGLKRFIEIIDLKDENDKAIGTRVDLLIPIE